MFVILMATYNGEKYIEEQIKSILGQSYKDWLLLVCDDGSSDSTTKIVNEYATKYYDKIKLITNNSEKHGAKANFFHLLQQAPKGEYYVFCDQDDVWTDDKLMVLKEEYHKIDNTVPALIYHNLKIVDNKLNVLNDSFGDYTELILNADDPFSDLIKYNYIPGCGMSFNYALKEIIRFAGDRVTIHDWWVILICAAFGRIYYVDKPLALYRQHSANTIGITSKAHGLTLIKRYISPGKLKKVFSMLKQGKRESYDIISELEDIYGDSLEPHIIQLIDKNKHYMTCKNKFAALLWGVKKSNRQNGILKNIYYWTSTLK